MKKALPIFLTYFLLFALPVSGVSQSSGQPTVNGLYMIALNGSEVTVDGALTDWADAQWVFLSVDHPFYGVLDAAANTKGYPETPADFSGWYAVKMDADHLYVAVRVRDEGSALVSTSSDLADLINFDHLSVYLGLYDIGTDASASPHSEVLSQSSGFAMTDPVTKAAVYSSGSYRISPDVDNTSSTLGPDYHLALRALDYSGAQADPTHYAFGLVNNTLTGTTASSSKWSDGKGYNLEWKIPFSSLAGKIAASQGAFANFEWPLFAPEDGMVLPMDVRLTDFDSGTPGDNTTQLTMGLAEDNDENASSFGARAQIVDLSKSPNNVPRWTYPIDYKSEQNVTIDADLSDWADASFRGLSQDQPNWALIQGTPQSPSDFSGYIGMKMDDDHLYVAVRVRDEGTPMIETFDTPNLAFNYDHLSMYLGLYDISDVPTNPHIEGPGEFEMYRKRTVKSSTGADSVVTDTLSPSRTYRISPETDNSGTTRGADYQMLLRALPYGPDEFDEPQTYNGAYVDTTIYEGTTVAAVLSEDETGYVMEWKIPFASLAGDISKGSREFKGVEWPLFAPEHGVTISFDADLTDRDERDGARGQNRFLRLGDQPALWRDSKSFKMRGLIVQTDGTQVSNESGQEFSDLPDQIELKQNYPNPFNPATQIEFSLPSSGMVTLSVFDVLGKEVARLADGYFTAGAHTVTFQASNLPSGTYIYQLRTHQAVATRKLTLIK